MSYYKCTTDKKYRKVKDHFHYGYEYSGIALNICTLKFVILKEIPVVSQNQWSSDNEFIINVLGKEFQ